MYCINFTKTSILFLNLFLSCVIISGMGKRIVTVARGDGIGPEIMDAVLHILDHAGAEIETEEIVIGEQLYHAGNTSGIGPEAWESLERTKLFLKAPITTPQGAGVKSLNVTVRKAFGLYANVRPTRTYAPYVKSKHDNMDIVIIRENEEGLYAGLEYQYSDDVMNAFKLVSRQGTERVIRFAFEYARHNSRKKVTCFAKDNILKITDGLFHSVFDEISADYPDIENEFWIVDIGCAKLANTPEIFDVLVMPNLYGDILSDMAGQISGSVGTAGAANIGDGFAMFEAIHGSAPRRAGQNVANPSALLFGAALMLAYIDQHEVATRIHNAWLSTMEEGYHTYDIYQEGVSKSKLGTKEFAEEIVQHLGKTPQKLSPVPYHPWSGIVMPNPKQPTDFTTEVAGVDVFMQDSKISVEKLHTLLEKISTAKLKISVIGNRGTKLWPDGFVHSKLSDVWQCRFRGPSVTDSDVIHLLSALTEQGMSFCGVEKLLHINGNRSYSLIQGE